MHHRFSPKLVGPKLVGPKLVGPKLLGPKLLGAVVAAGAMVATAVLPSAAGAAAPAIGHVFVIVLENEGYAATFGNPSADPYLASTLPGEGALLTQYYGTGHESNDNYVAMISGQGPNPQNQADCQIYTDFAGFQLPSAGLSTDEQAVGTGCVYPASVQTVANQLTAKGLSWKGYMEDMGNVAGREAAACGHPSLNSQDHTQSAVSGDGYVSRHDPFVYFHSIIDDAAYCDAHVVPLGTPSPGATSGLAADLQSISTTPNLSFITPDVCDDGHDYPCTNEQSGSSALSDVDSFLSTWVPADNGVARLPAGRPAGGHLRRVERTAVRFRGVLRRRAGTRRASARDHRSGGWQGGGGAAVAVHQKRDREQRRLQPLLVARLDRGRVRAFAPRLRLIGHLHLRQRRLRLMNRVPGA